MMGQKLAKMIMFLCVTLVMSALQWQPLGARPYLKSTAMILSGGLAAINFARILHKAKLKPSTGAGKKHDAVLEKMAREVFIPVLIFMTVAGFDDNQRKLATAKTYLVHSMMVLAHTEEKYRQTRQDLEVLLTAVCKGKRYKMPEEKEGEGCYRYELLKDRIKHAHYLRTSAEVFKALKANVEKRKAERAAESKEDNEEGIA